MLPNPYLEDPMELANLLSAGIRNAMEGFHGKHLTDTQMRELNPVIRNATYTVLHALRMMDRSETARAWVDYHSQHIPPYWESPELLEGYVRSMKQHGEDLEAA